MASNPAMRFQTFDLSDIRPLIERVQSDIRALVTLTVPDDDLAHQQIPAEGTE